MPKVDRSSKECAGKYIERFIPEKIYLVSVLSFLSRQIIHVNHLNSGNWNLNLDKNGQFLRFNVGQEYVLEIEAGKTKCLLLCMRKNLNEAILRDAGIIFMGANKLESKYLNEVPDPLIKVPHSVGCLINYKNFPEVFPHLETAHRNFIEYANQNTSISNKMRNAHSIGSISYLSQVTSQKISNPLYVPTYDSSELEAKTKEILQFPIKKEPIGNEHPGMQEVIALSYYRSPLVRAWIIQKARGVCELCGNNGPFITIDGNFFLETHHILSLADGGSDTVDNLVALCPNCHRACHLSIEKGLLEERLLKRIKRLNNFDKR